MLLNFYDWIMREMLAIKLLVVNIHIATLSVRKSH